MRRQRRRPRMSLNQAANAQTRAATWVGPGPRRREQNKRRVAPHRWGARKHRCLRGRRIVSFPSVALDDDEAGDHHRAEVVLRRRVLRQRDAARRSTTQHDGRLRAMVSIGGCRAHVEWRHLRTWKCLSSRFCPRGGTGDVRCWGLGQRRPRPRTASAAEDFCSKAHLERGSEGRWRAGSEVPWAHVRCCRRSGEGAAGAGCCRRQSVDCAGVLAVGGETRRAHGPRLASNS